MASFGTGRRPRVTAAMLALATAVACAGRSTAPESREPSMAGYTLVFADEFETPGSPDPARWGYDIGYIANNEKQYYTSRSENARVEDGVLVIEARREPYQGYAYTSARLVTRSLFEFRYGRVAVRAKLPAGRGAWPAIWTLGANIGEVGWPACGEIDIMENVGFDPLRVHASVHTAAYSQGMHRTASLEIKDPSADFHVYAMDWHGDRIEVSVDGRPYFSFRNGGTGSRTWPFDRPQYLLLNLAIGGNWGGQQGIDDALFPKRFEVDYVRVYRLD